MCGHHLRMPTAAQFLIMILVNSHSHVPVRPWSSMAFIPESGSGFRIQNSGRFLAILPECAGHNPRTPAAAQFLIMILVNGHSHVPVGPWSSMAFVSVRSKCPLVYIMATAQRFRLTPRVLGRLWSFPTLDVLERLWRTLYPQRKAPRITANARCRFFVFVTFFNCSIRDQLELKGFSEN